MKKFYGTGMLSAVFTTACHWSVSWAKCTLSTSILFL